MHFLSKHGVTVGVSVLSIFLYDVGEAVVDTVEQEAQVSVAVSVSVVVTVLVVMVVAVSVSVEVVLVVSVVTVVLYNCLAETTGLAFGEDVASDVPSVPWYRPGSPVNDPRYFLISPTPGGCTRRACPTRVCRHLRSKHAVGSSV